MLFIALNFSRNDDTYYEFLFHTFFANFSKKQPTGDLAFSFLAGHTNFCIQKTFVTLCLNQPCFFLEWQFNKLNANKFKSMRIVNTYIYSKRPAIVRHHRAVDNLGRMASKHMY